MQVFCPNDMFANDPKRTLGFHYTVADCSTLP